MTGESGEKRSTTDRMPGDLAARPPSTHGVGGRPGDPPLSAGGGGYQDVCTDSEFPIGCKKNRADPRLTDPRLQALREMGMHSRWITIAERVGMDDFLFIWRVLDGTRLKTTPMLSIPRFSRYLSFMRNQRIRQMAREGLSGKEIRYRVQAEFCEVISQRHVDRLTEEIRSSKGEADI